jgi:solute carrier family 25 phosphate transporter 23/24/25/41
MVLSASYSGAPLPQPNLRSDRNGEDYGEEGEDEDLHTWLEGHTAVKFLLAGGIAGASKFRTEFTRAAV